MKVFKNYFKIVWAHRTAIIIYTVIFAALLVFSTKSDNKEAYKSVGVDIYLNDKAGTELSKALSRYLAKNDKIVDMDESLVEDKLFYGSISAMLEIPEDFDEAREVLYRSAPNDIYAMNVKEKVNIYLSQVAAYEKASFDLSDAIKYSDEDLEKNFDIAIKGGSAVKTDEDARFFFNFLNYLLLSQIILIVSIIVKVYKRKKIAMRNLASPVPSKKMNLYLTLGHIANALIVWFLYMLLYVILYKYDFSKLHVNLMMLNSLVFTTAIVPMALMISSLVKNDNAVGGVTNVVSLGSSFLCGAFVPQEFLGETALKIGKIFPSYYYIQNNDVLASNPSFDAIKTNLLIMLGFAALFIVITVVAKPKTNDNVN